MDWKEKLVRYFDPKISKWFEYYHAVLILKLESGFSLMFCEHFIILQYSTFPLLKLILTKESNNSE